MEPRLRTTMTTAAVAGIIAVSGVLGSRRRGIVNSDSLKLVMQEHPTVAEDLIAAAERDDEERRRILRSVALKFAGVIVGFLTPAFLLAQIAALTTTWSSPPPALPGVIGTVYHISQGRLRPDTALSSVLGALAVCATINVSLAVKNNAAKRRDQIASSIWRCSLSAAAVILSISAVALGFAVWASAETRADTGTALATSLFAFVSVALAITSKQQPNSVDRARGYRRAVKRLKDLDAWEIELSRRGVPPHAGRIFTRATGNKFPWRTIRRCGNRLLLIGLAADAYLTLLLLIGIAVGLSRHHTPEFSWRIVVVFLGYWWVAAVIALIIGNGSLQRWASYTSAHARWQLDLKPRLIRGGYLLFAALIAAATWVTDGVVMGLYWLGLLIVVPAVTWLILWSSRRWNHAKVARWLGAPFWELVDWSIYNSRRTHMEQRDRLWRDEMDERNQRDIRDSRVPMPTAIFGV
jgi:hypothetical protein